MSEASRREVRAGLEPSLARLWRYALVLSRARDVADDLVQATCLRAIERADQFVPGTRVDRWLLAILRSIWLNEIRSRRVREGGGFVEAEDVLTTDGAREIEMNITASAPRGAARSGVARLRRRVQLRGSGGGSRRSDRHDHEQIGHRASGAGEIEIGGLGKHSYVRR
jgi:DNA-directed RNA polymerase specialized sigma24 family protein